MNANIMISHTDTTIVVDVSMEYIDDLGDRQRLTTKEIEEYLTSKKIKFGKVLASCSLCNDNPESLLGHWIFEKLTIDPAQDEVQSPKPRRGRRKNEDKQNKS